MNDALQLTMPLWEIAARTTVVFMVIVVVMRVVPKRRSGTLSPNDMIGVVLIAAIAGDAIMGGSTSIADNLVMVGIIVCWQYVFEFLEYQFPTLHRFLRDTETPLVVNGRILRRNLKYELITEEELWAALREDGVEDLGEVRSACLEADGRISVIKKRSEQ